MVLISPASLDRLSPTGSWHPRLHAHCVFLAPFPQRRDECPVTDNAPSLIPAFRLGLAITLSTVSSQGHAWRVGSCSSSPVNGPADPHDGERLGRPGGRPRTWGGRGPHTRSGQAGQLSQPRDMGAGKGRREVVHVIFGLRPGHPTPHQPCAKETAAQKPSPDAPGQAGNKLAAECGQLRVERGYLGWTLGEREPNRRK